MPDETREADEEPSVVEWSYDISVPPPSKRSRPMRSRWATPHALG